MPISKLGQRRQVVIPQDICDALGLEIGDFLELVQDGRTVVIKPKKLVDPEEILSRADEKSIREGIEDIQRGDVKPWSEVKHDLGL